MKALSVKYVVLDWVSKLSMLILLLLPFHAFLTVWGSSLVGHYTALRLWKEVALLLCALGVLFLLVFDQKIRSHTITRRLVWTILAYIALTIVWGLLALNQHDVTAKALGYGLISNLRYLVFFLVTWSVALRLQRLRSSWHWLVVGPAVVVVIIGLLQIFVLPYDFLRHFGYGNDTIPAYETVNSNLHYVRATSTLRGANPLGAYLLIPISLVTVQLIRKSRNWRYAGFLVAAVIVLLFSYSRAALVGAAISVLIILALSRLSRRTYQLAVGATAVCVIALAGLFLAFRHNSHFQNFAFHTEDHSMIKTTSNGDHASALRSGLNDFADHKLGRGPGTAGPASFYNTGQPIHLAENYYIQIGQEVGVIGLGLFLLINIGVGYLLWGRRDDPLALALFASLIGLSFINLLSHAWTDDTLAYIWWGLAGIAMVSLPGETKAKSTKTKK